MYSQRADKHGLHLNLTSVHGDGGSRNPIPRHVAETRGFALSVPKDKKSLKGLPRATHCTDRAQSFGIVTLTVELCPPHLTFRTKVRARRDMPQENKKMTIIRIHISAPKDPDDGIGIWSARCVNDSHLAKQKN